MRSISNTEEYATAKQELRDMFNADACHTGSKAAHELMRALDFWEAKCIKKSCTEENQR